VKYATISPGRLAGMKKLSFREKNPFCRCDESCPTGCALEVSAKKYNCISWLFSALRGNLQFTAHWVPPGRKILEFIPPIKK
jgi:hypothetical protein